MMPDPFDVLELEPRFDLDGASLRRRFIELAGRFHPDRFVDPMEQADAAERTAHINRAYHLLRDPAARAEALLARLGGPAAEEDKSLPPDLLMEMMEVREQLEEAAAAEDEAAIEQWRRWADEQKAGHLDRLASLFAAVSDASADGEGDGADEVDEVDEAALKAIRIELNVMRYIDRMLEQMPGQRGAGL